MSVRDDNILSDTEHLYAEDFEGRDVTLTVTKIEREETSNGRGGKDRKYTFHFAETAKSYIPGVTVRREISRACGSNNRHNIIGKRLVFYPTVCEAFGKNNTPCIRFRGLAKDSKPTPAHGSAPNRAGNGTAAPNTGLFDDNAEGATDA